MTESENTVQFTVILYGIVASIALFRITNEVSLRNGMLLFAFFILATDWIEYQLSVENVSTSVDNQLLMFALDMAILVVWTVLTVLRPLQLPVYLLVVGVFVLLQGAWDSLLLTSSHRGVVGPVNVELPAVYAILLAVHWYYSIPRPVLFGIGVVAFVGWKFLAWTELYTEAKQAESISGV